MCLVIEKSYKVTKNYSNISYIIDKSLYVVQNCALKRADVWRRAARFKHKSGCFLYETASRNTLA